MTEFWKRLCGRKAACLALLAAICLGQGWYAVHLNRTYYRTWGPFFDSVSYHNSLARVMAASREEGFPEGLQKAAKSGTVFLPMLLGAVLGPFFEPDRAIGVWLQSIWVFALLASLWFYFRVCLKAGPWLALALSLPFGSIHAIYFFNGGLADFRMDLHLYLLFGCSLAWFFIALETGRLGAWAVCGLFAAFCSLSRATAPVYLGLTFLPVLALFLLAPERRKQAPAVFRGCLVAGGVAALLSTWFFVLNFEQLHYYYVVWNPDANAHLPWRESSRHVGFALDSIGSLLLAAAVPAVVLLSWPAFRAADRSLFFRFWASPRFWKLVPAVTPLAFLVGRGAGLNPFVSMPGAFGILFFLLSLPGDLQKTGRVAKSLAASLLLLACLGTAWRDGLRFKPSPGLDSFMAGYRRVIDAILEDARAHGISRIEMGTVTLGSFNDYAVQNILIFEYRFQPLRWRLFQGGLEFSTGRARDFTPSSKVEWAQFEGQSPETTIQQLVKKAEEGIGYMVLPDEATTGHLKKNLSFNYINNFSAYFRDLLLAEGAWEPLTGKIHLSEHEYYLVYANRKRLEHGRKTPGTEK